ncbi:hypothetical protein EV356DRAFT_520886 [Viridothelium virens]|uniref:HAD-like protein n=1 Tax=Viridothelium virens TaxID=1048519 RepID=A0A6A6HJI9_VIRVR|nr:hypothetical protein EV356DRAFT_520886 [Viridothelium virens]
MRRPIFLFLDWDGTITHNDTTHLIGRVGSNHQRQVRTTLKDPWHNIVQAYSKDLDRHQRTYKPGTSQRKSIAEEQKWLESLSFIESRSIQRVEEAGIFKGVTQSEMEDAGGTAVEDGSLHLRKGWDRLLVMNAGYLASKKQVAFPILSKHIISVSWSESFIQGALQYAAQHPNASQASSGCDSRLMQSALTQLAISANELDGIENAAGSTGLMSRVYELNIRTSKDKLQTMEYKLRQDLGFEIDSTEPYCIYVGDSATDLECLLAANVGICVRDEPMQNGQKDLAETLARLGVNVGHTTEFDGLGGEREMQNRVYWARDLEEVRKMVREMFKALDN